MKLVDTVLSVSLVALAGTGSLWLSGELRQRRSAPADRALRIDEALDVEFSACEALTGADAVPGSVWFELGADERLLGLASAVVYPEHEGRPLLGKGANVVFVQRWFGLDMQPFLQAVPELRWRHLNYGLWVEGTEGPELRVGWARFHAVDLTESGLRICAEARNRVVVEVTSTNGAAVPGARVAFDEHGFVPGAFHCSAATDENGELRISGLPDSGRWSLSLPLDIGPSRGTTKAHPLTASQRRVRLVADLPGDWTYVRYRLSPPNRGYPLRIANVASESPGRARVWPASPWLGPEGWPASDVYLMYRSDRTAPAAVQLHVADFDPPLEVSLADEGASYALRYDPSLTANGGECGGERVGDHDHAHEHTDPLRPGRR